MSTQQSLIQSTRNKVHSRRLDRWTVTVVLVLSYFFLPKYGYVGVLGNSTEELANHILYPISHANVFHLTANILFIWMVRCDMRLLETITIAILCSFIPTLTTEPTMGFSGVLFAMVGITWGRVSKFKEMFLKNKWIFLIMLLVPHVNFLIHLYCLLAGYAYGMLLKDRKLCV